MLLIFVALLALLCVAPVTALLFAPWVGVKPPTPPPIPKTQNKGLPRHCGASDGVCEFSVTDWLSERI